MSEKLEKETLEESLTSTTTYERYLEKFPSPKGEKLFKRKWKLFLPEIAGRPNFKLSQLAQLEVLCDLYAEYSNLKDFIKKQGYVYANGGGRTGNLLKPHVEVIRLGRVEHLIKEYSRILGLMTPRTYLPEMTEGSGEETEWE